MEQLMQYEWFQELTERLEQVFTKLSIKFILKLLLPF